MSIFDTTVSPAVAEARLLHPQSGGYFTVGSKGPDRQWKEEHFPVSVLDAVSHSLRGRLDTYISQSTFASKRRLSCNTKSLRCVFVDLDYYNTKHANSHPELVADHATALALSLGLPAPSYIVDSGCGLYVKWVFDTPIHAGQMPAWKLLQRKLVSAYLELGADTMVVDMARVLRLPETLNRKNGADVRVLRQGRTYAFADLLRASAGLEVMRIDKISGKVVRGSDSVIHKGVRLKMEDLITDEALTDQVGLDLYAASRLPVMLARMSKQSLNWSRFLDLRDLVQARGGIHRGSRDVTLFWMVNFLAQSGVIDASNFWHEVKELLGSFPVCADFNPMNDGSLVTLFRRIQAHARGEKNQFDGVSTTPVYTPRNDTLLNQLQISPDEERQMRTIISAQEKLRRADEKVPCRALRREERKGAQEVATVMVAEGVTLTEIARTLGKNKSTISRWMKPELRVGLPYTEKRGRKPCSHKKHVKFSARAHLQNAQGEVPLRPNNLNAVSRKVKIYEQKPHLRSDHVCWTHEQVRSWLAFRNRLPHPGAGIPLFASRKNLREAALLLDIDLVQRIRNARQAYANSISIATAPSVSSITIAAP